MMNAYKLYVHILIHTNKNCMLVHITFENPLYAYVFEFYIRKSTYIY